LFFFFEFINHRIRTYTVKFIETVILVQTPSEHDSIKRNKEFCLDHVPITVKAARPRKLEEDAKYELDANLPFDSNKNIECTIILLICELFQSII